MNSRQFLSKRVGAGTTLTSSYMNSSMKTLNTTGRATTSIFNMSVCSNATTGTDIGRSATLMCLVKGRGKAVTETGVASMDLRRNVVRMSQFCDDQLYSQLMTQVYMVDPVEIVVAQTLRESSVLDGMFDKLNRNFPKATIRSVPRRYMNENKGREFVRSLCSRDSSGVDVALESKVYALLALSGLLCYIEDSFSMYLAPHTLRMVYHSGANCMLMDHGTAINLELLRSTGSSTGSNQVSQSLYSIINRTKTLTGALTLRANLLEPPTEKALIEARYEAVEEFMDNIEMFTSLQSALAKFPDIEKVISLCIQIPKLENRCTAESKIKSALCLKTALDLVPCITEVLRPAQSTLIKNSRQRLMNDGLERILQLIVDKLNSNASVTSGLLSMKGQVVFAVKQGLDGKLDAMRDVYNSLVDQIEDMLQFLSETYQLALRLSYSNQRGFHCTLKIPKNSETPSIPPEFIKVSRGRGVFSMTTDKLVILNARITECLDSIYGLSNRIVTQLLTEVHKEIPCLNSLVHAIGHLDMLLSFTSISRQPDYVRPELGELLALKTAKHPVAEVTSSGPVVPNDVYMTEESNMMIITGANNSGKSFYLRTVAVLQVLAQIGCFVPASFAMVRVCDQLFSRIGSDSSVNNMESSFTVEMKEIAFVLKHKTPTALIILDELCRGTSTHEAVDICFTICQQLLKMSAFTLFATHFKELCQLESIHVNCSNFCFVTHYEDSEVDRTVQRISNDHKLVRGIAKGARYGLKLAATMNFPTEVIKYAFAIADKLDRLENESQLDDSAQTTSSDDLALREEMKIYKEISLIAKHGGSLPDKVASLRQLQTKYGEQLQTVKSSRESRILARSEKSNALSTDLSAALGICSDKNQTQVLNMVNCSLSSQSEVSADVSTVRQHSSSAPNICFSIERSLSNSQQDNRSIELPRAGTVTSGVALKKRVKIARSPTHDFLGNISSSSPDRESDNKLVDYSVSSIELAGSLIHNPHSEVTSPAKIVYRASTRKSRDPLSPPPYSGVSNDSSVNSFFNIDEAKSVNSFFNFNKSRSESQNSFSFNGPCGSNGYYQPFHFPDLVADDRWASLVFSGVDEDLSCSHPLVNDSNITFKDNNSSNSEERILRLIGASSSSSSVNRPPNSQSSVHDIQRKRPRVTEHYSGLARPSYEETDKSSNDSRMSAWRRQESATLSTITSNMTVHSNIATALGSAKGNSNPLIVENSKNEVIPVKSSTRLVNSDVLYPDLSNISPILGSTSKMGGDITLLAGSHLAAGVSEAVTTPEESTTPQEPVSFKTKSVTFDEDEVLTSANIKQITKGLIPTRFLKQETTTRNGVSGNPVEGNTNILNKTIKESENDKTEIMNRNLSVTKAEEESAAAVKPAEEQRSSLDEERGLTERLSAPVVPVQTGRCLSNGEMSLLDELLNASQQSQSRANREVCLSSIKVEPK